MGKTVATCSFGRRLDLLLIVLSTFLSMILLQPCYVVASIDELPGSDVNADGYTNLQEGSRLFQLGRYNEASAYLWRAVLLQEKAKETVSLRYFLS
jgi:hypothetical protein